MRSQLGLHRRGRPMSDGTPPPGTEPESDLDVYLDRVEGLKAHFKASGGEPPLTYDFGDGTTHTPSDGYNTAHTYAEAGAFTVTVTDAEGHTDTLVVRIVSDASENPETAEELHEALEARKTHSALDAWVQDHEAFLPERPDNWTALTLDRKRDWVMENYDFEGVEPDDEDGF
jgi:PKD domain